MRSHAFSKFAASVAIQICFWASAWPAKAQPQEHLFGVTVCCPNKFVRVNLVSGEMEILNPLVGDASVFFSGGASAIDPENDKFFVQVIQGTPPTMFIRTIDTRTGAYSDSASVSDSLSGMEFDSISRKLVAVTGCCPNMLVQVHPSSGVTEYVGEVGDMSVFFSLGGSALDPFRGKYFLSIVKAPTMSAHIRVFDLPTGSFVDSPALSEQPGILQFDTKKNRLIAVTRCCPNKLIVVDPVTGDITVAGEVASASEALAPFPVINPIQRKLYLQMTRLDVPGHFLRMVNLESGRFVNRQPLAESLIFMEFGAQK